VRDHPAAYLAYLVVVTCCLLQPDVVKPGIIVQGILLDLCLILETPLTYYDVLQRQSTEAQCGQHQQYNMPVSVRVSNSSQTISRYQGAKLQQHTASSLAAPNAACNFG